ncbi:hypothetical protein JCM3775_007247 [Rhodotorula graminis]
MSRYLSHDGVKATRYRPRQSSYLRISPTQVLQMTLYLEPAHVDWMSDDILDKMLVALKDRIPLKLAKEIDPKKKGGKERRQVDVYRGTGYQMAFYFRSANDKHVVLLKDKNIHFLTRSPSTVRAPSRVAPSPFPPPPPSRKRARTASAAPRDDEGDVLSSGSDGEGPSTAAATPSKRRAGVAASGARDEGDAEDELVVVKPEPDEEAPPLGWTESAGGGYEGDVKPEIDEDVKPEVTVTYRGFTIFGRTLVVIVEPYPALDPADLARPRLLDTEVRQLSASVAPESYRNGRSTIPRGSSLSVTPAPPRAPGGRGALFRSETTPAESVGGSVAPSELGGEGEGDGDGEDESMRRLREMSMMLANDDDGDEDLPSLDALVGRARGRRNVEGAAVEPDTGEEGGTT